MRGLASPHTFLGATSSVEFWIMLGGFTVIQYMRQSLVAFGCYFTHFLRFYEALVFGSHWSCAAV